jgi:hypothetical protein
MQKGREKSYTAPKVFLRPSRTHPTFFLLPSTVPKKKNRTKLGRG